MDSIGRANISTHHIPHQAQTRQQSDSDAGDPQEQPRDRYESLAPEEDLCPDAEHDEGERHESELLEKYAVWDDPEAHDLLAELYHRLSHVMAREEVTYEFLALDTHTPFASSCPNGAIFFTRSLITSLSFDDVLFFAAHELAHTELRHYASRGRRLSQLRQLIPAPIGSPTRQRLDLAAVLTVRHQEEFEADHQAALWLDQEIGTGALSALQALCQKTSPDSLQRPTHPPFKERIASLKEQREFPSPLQYTYSLLS